jgi:hypothetical protein
MPSEIGSPIREKEYSLQWFVEPTHATVATTYQLKIRDNLSPTWYQVLRLQPRGTGLTPPRTISKSDVVKIHIGHGSVLEFSNEGHIATPSGWKVVRFWLVP